MSHYKNHDFKKYTWKRTSESRLLLLIFDVLSDASRKKNTFSAVGFGQDSIPFLSTQHKAVIEPSTCTTSVLRPSKLLLPCHRSSQFAITWMAGKRVFSHSNIGVSRSSWNDVFASFVMVKGSVIFNSVSSLQKWRDFTFLISRLRRKISSYRAIPHKLMAIHMIGNTSGSIGIKEHAGNSIKSSVQWSPKKIREKRTMEKFEE